MHLKLAQDKHDGDSDESSGQWEVLFDGSTLDHFRGYKEEAIGRGWKIDDGILMFDGSGGGDLMTKKQYGNFELTFDWKVDPGSNSGVMYLVSTGDSAPYESGPEYQILDDDKHPDGKNPLTSAASLYGMYKPIHQQLNRVGLWNSAKIVILDGKIQHWLNGKKVVEAQIKSDDWNERKNASKFKDWKKFGNNTAGYICFQDHGNKVWFRDIKIKSLDDK